ncbi:MAG TPA: CorA family divalent cation transporter [Candidatus Nitrosocosmicus sp.]
MQTTIFYNRNNIEENKNKPIIKDKFNLWLDIVDPTPKEISDIQKEFGLDGETLKVVERQTKRPQIRIHENYNFTILLDIKYGKLDRLSVKAIYIFSENNWLITIHTSEVDLLTPIRHLIYQKNKKIIESNIDALYYSMITEIINKYEQLLTSIELTISGIEQKSIYSDSSKKILNYLDVVTREIIIIRRHLWYTRDVVNFLIHMEKGSDDIKYLKIAYDNINQLIELVKSYRDTINSSRELFIANVAMQTTDAIRILTVINTLLLPLTVITGVYGIFGIDMTKIKEFPQGLYAVVIIMIIITFTTLWFFKKKRWLFNASVDLKNEK